MAILLTIPDEVVTPHSGVWIESHAWVWLVIVPVLFLTMMWIYRKFLYSVEGSPVGPPKIEMPPEAYPPKNRKPVSVRQVPPVRALWPDEVPSTSWPPTTTTTAESPCTDNLQMTNEPVSEG